MSGNGTAASEIESFIESWTGDDEPMRHWFQVIYQELKGLADVELQFIARAGVSYSIRPKHNNQQDRDLFAIVDVIDDDPSERWLSVCFYEDMITDPEERGELIPGGLAGSDGYCFDMCDNDEVLAKYLLARIAEAATSASS
ncbi:MAG: hypothetical protein ACI8ZB_000043 [Desulforhopalus sp.]|jgi:hypothetical protein